MRWSEIKVYLSTLLLSMVIGGGAIFATVRHLKPGSPPKHLSFTSEQVLGKEAHGSAGYALVEFIDYQCPPCRLE